MRQMGVALYFIDKLALRAGHEKDEDEAETVGCCTLKVCSYHCACCPEREYTSSACFNKQCCHADDGPPINLHMQCVLIQLCSLILGLGPVRYYSCSPGCGAGGKRCKPLH